MDQLVEIPNIKTEPTDSTSSKQQEILNEMQSNSIKQKSHCLVQSEVIIKTEPSEDENDFPMIASTSFEMCSNCDIKCETEELLIKIELKDPVDETLQDPLDVRDEIKVEASISNLDSVTSLGQTKQEAYIPISGDEESHDSNTSNNQDQLFVENKKFRKDKEHVCSICNKAFEFKSKLDTHLLIHTGERPYSCVVCTRSFVHKGHLNTHMLVHSGEKPHSCDICKKVFRCKSSVIKHMLTHSGEKPFSCKECNKSFAQKSNFVVHKRLHTGEKPFTCDVCEKAFTNKSSLTEHRRTHTGEKPYCCSICNESFADKSNFSRHKKNHKN